RPCDADDVHGSKRPAIRGHRGRRGWPSRITAGIDHRRVRTQLSMTSDHRRTARWISAALLLAAAVSLPAAKRQTAVRVWQGSIELPTYAEDAANPNPPFELFTFGRLNYPYPIRDALSDRRERVAWRSLNLENEYLRVTV